MNYSHALARRLPAETLFDAVFRVTGSTPRIPGAKPGQRATQLADAATDTGTGLLATLGRPARQSACECERSSDMRLGSVMALLSGPTISEAINEPTNALAKLVAEEPEDRKLVNDVFLRVVNRPATEPEITNVLALLSEVTSDNHVITNELAGLEVKMAPTIQKLQHERDDAIAKAKAELGVYDDMTKNLRAELEKRHQSEIALTRERLKEHEQLIPAQAAFLETKYNPADIKTVWAPVEVTKASAARKVALKKLPDGSILSTGKLAVADFKIDAKTPLKKITGVMLEVIPDDSLPRLGPGRAPDGNFVLTEFELRWSEGTNTTLTPGKFTDARADFSQQNFTVQMAIDGVLAGANGWAVAGAAPGALRHTAMFKLDPPIASTNDLKLQFTMKHNYAPEFLIGRFRLYVTGSDAPLEAGLPQSIVQAIQAAPGERTPQQSAAIVDFYRNSDTEFWKRKQALADANAPLPADPKFTTLQTGLKNAEMPIRLDPYLVQLREDAKASGRQNENKRLTVVQDLTWALINSPGFLFNH